MITEAPIRQIEKQVPTSREQEHVASVEEQPIMGHALPDSVRAVEQRIGSRVDIINGVYTHNNPTFTDVMNKAHDVQIGFFKAGYRRKD